MAGWGKPKYSSGPSGQNFSLKEGDNVYRFLPPMHSLAEDGIYSVYVATHFGYRGTDPTDQNKTKLKTFKCIQVDDRRSGMVLEECPECTLIEKNKAELQAKEAELRSKFKAEGRPDSEVEELLDTELDSLRGWIKNHNVDRKHYFNVMTPDGHFGQLKLSHRTKKQQLDVMFKKLSEEDGIDPLDLDQGVLINIKRSGKVRDVVDVVEVVKEKVVINGKKLEEIKTRPLSEEEATAALESCRDLSTAGGFVLTKDQIAELTESSGDPEEVDRVFGWNNNKEDSKKTSQATKPAPARNEAQAATPAPTPDAEVKPQAQAQPEAAVDPRVAQRMAEIKAKKEAEEKAKREAEAQKAAAASVEDLNPLEMNDEDFLAKFG